MSTEDDKAAEAAAKRKRNKARVAALKLTLADWVWVANAGVFVERETGKRMTAPAWRSLMNEHDPEKDILQRVWRTRIVSKFTDLVYLPSEVEMPDGPEGGRLNVWRKSGIDPVEGDVTWFESHLEFLFPDESDRKKVIDYLSILIQFPRLKLMFALLITGRVEGTGKSAIGELMKYIIGEANVVKPTSGEILHPVFSEWQEGASLAIIEELWAPKGADLANTLKQVIVDPQLRINRKHASAYSLPNHLNLLAFSNHGDALKLTNTDRRWLVVHTNAVPKEPDYYSDLFDNHIETVEGQSAVKHWLGAWDIGLNPKARAPMTDAKAEMRELTMLDHEGNAQEAFEAESPPFNNDLVRLEDVMAIMFPDKWDRRNDKRALASKWLLSIGAVKHKRLSGAALRANLTGRDLYSVRAHERWSAVSARARAEAYASHMEGDDDDDDGAWLDEG